jgi:AcrR family transcriptional regulator
MPSTQARGAAAHELWRPRPSHHGSAERWRPTPASPPIAEFRRARILRAASELALQCSYQELTVSSIVARARVSRRTFYDIFDGLEDYFLAAIEEAIGEIAAALAPLYAAEGSWRLRLRGALALLLAELNTRPGTAALAVGYLVGHGPRAPELRRDVLDRLCQALEDGRRESKAPRVLAPLASELIVLGALSVIHSRLASEEPLEGLLNPLMWTIVLPYLGAGAAAREMQHAPASLAERNGKPSGDALPSVEMRVTYRTMRVLATIDSEPGLSNMEVGERAGISDQGQTSKLLARLTRLGLVENTGAGRPKGTANAWRLTPTGREFQSALQGPRTPPPSPSISPALQAPRRRVPR